MRLGRSQDAFTNTTPSYQIFYYMQHTGLEWGVLTNGRLWQLFHKATAHKLDVYYEVDLHELATGGDVKRFLYFYAVFRRAAFDPGPLSASSILEASEAYAQGVGETLKVQVYDALRLVAQGFLDYPAEPAGRRRGYSAGDLQRLAYRALPAAVHPLRRGARSPAGASERRVPRRLQPLQHQEADRAQRPPGSGTRRSKGRDVG
ncbi:MAG: hypothetical protein WKH64_04370 [Chloroflexia bacterium]